MATRSHPAITLLRSGALRPRPRRRGADDGTGLEVDPLAAGFLADPHGAYRALHADGGHGRCPHRDLWVLAGHDDVRAGARAHDVLSSAQGVTVWPARTPMMLTLDRPEHTRLRRLVAPHFTAAAALRRRPRMEEVAAAAIDRMLARPGADAVAELAIPLPVIVIADVLGIPEHDVDRLKRWSDGIVEGFHVDDSLRAIPAGARVSWHLLALHRYLRRTLRRLGETPDDDVLSVLLASRGQDGLSEEELFWFALMLLVAGNETTTNLLGSLLLALAQDPDAYARLRAEPALIPSAVEEALRWGSPVQGMYREATNEHVVRGGTVPAGARVLLLFGAANRDPARYPDPDRFVVDRAPDDHLAFGAGIHFCLGAHLARLEATVVLEQLLARVARIEPAGPVSWTANPSVRGPARLPLRLEAV